jgi:hypothetical protein
MANLISPLATKLDNASAMRATTTNYRGSLLQSVISSGSLNVRLLANELFILMPVRITDRVWITGNVTTAGTASVVYTAVLLDRTSKLPVVPLTVTFTQLTVANLEAFCSAMMKNIIYDLMSNDNKAIVNARNDKEYWLALRVDREEQAAVLGSVFGYTVEGSLIEATGGV